MSTASKQLSPIDLPVSASAPRTLMARIGGALSFSHLAGLGKGAKSKGPRAEDERESEEDSDKPKNRKGKKADKGDDDKDYDEDEHEDQDRSNGDSKKGKKAESDGKEDDEERDEDGEGVEDGEDKPKNRKGKKADDEDDSENAEDDDDGDEEMHGKSLAARARRRERARCAAIFSDKAAARNPQLAAQLAFSTTLKRSEALKVLRAGGPGNSASSSSERRDRNPRLGLGDPELTGTQAIAAGWDTAMSKARPGQK